MNNIYVFGMSFNVLSRFTLIGKSILDGLTACLVSLKPHSRISIYISISISIYISLYIYTYIYISIRISIYITFITSIILNYMNKI